MKMNTEDFRFFTRVAELGSMSKAAKEENIAVSVASQRIQRLENSLSLRLFYRTTRKLTLTEQGKKLLTDGRDFIESFHHLTDELKLQDQQISGRIHITASATFGNYILMKAITGFLKEHPLLEIDLDLNDQNVDLIERGFDLAIRIGELQDSTLIAKPLSHNSRVLCASPEYVHQFGLAKSLDDLKQHRCILQRHQQGLTNIWNFIDEHQGPISVQVNGPLTCNSGESIRQASLAGFGISNHSLWHVQQDLAEGTLVQVLAAATVKPTTIYAITPNRKYTPYKIKVLIAYLSQYFESQVNQPK